MADGMDEDKRIFAEINYVEEFLDPPEPAELQASQQGQRKVQDQRSPQLSNHIFR